jgi:hypothetical protein
MVCRGLHHTEVFNAKTLQLCLFIPSPGLQISGLLGHAARGEKKSPAVSDAEVGIGGCCQWKLQGLDHDTTVAVMFEVTGTGQSQGDQGQVSGKPTLWSAPVQFEGSFSLLGPWNLVHGLHGMCVHQLSNSRSLQSWTPVVIGFPRLAEHCKQGCVEGISSM